MAPLRKAAELETELNRLNAAKELEGLRATVLSHSTVEAESAAKVCVWLAMGLMCLCT